MVTTTGPIPPLSGIAPMSLATEVQAATPLLRLTEPEATDVAELSQLGALLSRLTDLQRTDPAHAQRALLAMASDLAGRATLSGGDAQLRALADAFARAAETGDLSGVRPLGPPRADELIESTAPNTATAHGQAASYALGQAPLRPRLDSLLEDALSRTKLENHSASPAEAEHLSADRIEQRRVEQTQAEHRSADRVEQRHAEQAALEQHSADRAELEHRSADRVEQLRAEQVELEQRSADRAELEQRSANRVVQLRAEQAALEQRRAAGTAE